MRVAILSQFPRKYTTRRLKEACEKRGHDVRVVSPTAFSILVDEGRPTLLYQSRPFEPVDAVIPRIGASITFFGTAVLRQLEQMGVFTLNPSHAIAAARDKLRSIQILSRHPIGLAHTAFVKHPAAILPAIRAVGGAPVIIKLLEGTQGIGVILADSEKGAQSIVETLQEARQNVLIQKFVAESRGKDIRALILGGRVVAAMRRSARGDEFRSNIHRGGSAEAVKLDPEYERTAVEATRILGLRLAGVDMLEGRDGPKVMEVNSSPGFQAIERVTGVDLADAVLSFVEKDGRFPEVDLVHRLSLPDGYGIVEIAVDVQSELCNRTVAECRMRDRKAMLLAIVRDGRTLPDPPGNETIRGGDLLLCYGHLKTLAALTRS